MTYIVTRSLGDTCHEKYVKGGNIHMELEISIIFMWFLSCFVILYTCLYVKKCEVLWLIINDNMVNLKWQVLWWGKIIIIITC